MPLVPLQVDALLFLLATGFAKCYQPCYTGVFTSPPHPTAARVELVFSTLRLTRLPQVDTLFYLFADQGGEVLNVNYM